MDRQRFDCVVLGRSLAGVECALRLAREGVRVALSDWPDNGEIEDSARVYLRRSEAGPIVPDPCGGIDADAYSKMVRDAMNRSGIDWMTDIALPIRPESGNADEAGVGDAIRLCAGNRTVETESLVFAPVGSLPRRHWEPWERHFNYGVSMCASSDWILLRDRHAAVVGHGPRCFEQALVAARRARFITILHEGPLPRDERTSRLLRLCEASPNITWRSAEDARPIAAESRDIEGVRFVENGKTREIPAYMVFLGHPFEPDWSPFAEMGDIMRRWERDGRFLTAGLAAGPQCRDDEAAAGSGRFAAERVLARTKGANRT